jgi:hypothetical protein
MNSVLAADATGDVRQIHPSEELTDLGHDAAG